MKRIVHVIAHTHWDREWYMPHQTSVARLIAVMERIVAMMEQNELDTFLFDGQTAALEDLLAQCEPALAERVKRLVGEGRIVVGPWYVMADEFLVSGESLLRNLELGIADARAYGREQRVGYLPDTFGHVAQMPQILREYGIDCAVVWRGIDIEPSEFAWSAHDGSVVNALFLTQGYYQHPLNVAEWRSALETYLAKIAPRATTSHLVLTQGGDHLLPHHLVNERLNEFNRTQGEYALRWSTLEHAIAETFAATGARSTQSVKGELRHNKQAFVLPDVLSTRRYLKHMHQRAEDRLIGEIEPLLVKFSDAENYPKKYLDQCWRLLVQQQAHDSICGCSVDEVHREMETRFVQIEQRLSAIARGALARAGMWSDSQHAVNPNAVSVFGDDTTFTLFNPLPQTFEGWQTIELFVKGERIANPGLSIAHSESGSILTDFELIALEASYEFHSPLDDFPDRVNGFRYSFLVHTCLTGLSTLSLRIESTVINNVTNVNETGAKGDIENAIENEWLRVSIASTGSLSIVDRKTNRSIEHAITFAHEHDVGDSYNFCPTPAHEVRVVNSFSLIGVRKSRTTQTMTVVVRMRVPASIESDRATSASEFVENTGEMTLTLCAGSPAVSCTLQWRNRSKDQRTRLLLRWLPNAASVTLSDSAFSLDRRAVRTADYPKEITRSEMPVAVHPSHSIVIGGGWWLAHHAMQEHEVVDVNGERSLAMTLVRSVGWLSRRDLVTRGVGAGPDFETPDAQCLRAEVFEFAFGLAVSDEGAVKQAFHAARLLRRPLLVLRGYATSARPSVDIGNDILQISNTRIVADHIEIRLWNPTGEPQSIAIDTNVWRRVRADGTPLEAPVDMVAPYAIHTLRAPLPARASAIE